MVAWANESTFSHTRDGRTVLSCPLVGRSADYFELFEQRPFLEPLYTGPEKEGLSVCYGLRLSKEKHLEVLGLAAAYLLFVYVSSQPSKVSWKLPGLLPLWNGALCLFSALGALRTLPHLASNLVAANYDLERTLCEPPESMAPGAGAWGLGATGVWVQLFVAAKGLELLDALVLKARNKPITFMHWFQHVTTLLYTYHAYATESAHTLYFVAMNFTCQSCVYGYYALRAFGRGRGLAKAVTVVQVSQMGLGLLLQALALRYSARGACSVAPANLMLGAAVYAAYLAMFAKLLAVRFLAVGNNLCGPRSAIAAGLGALLAAAWAHGAVRGADVANVALLGLSYLAAAQAYERLVRFPAWPSPRGTLPLLGNAVQAAPGFMRFLLREAKKEKSGLFLFWPGGPKPLLVVANPAAAKQVLAHPKAFPKGGDYGNTFGFVFGNGLVTSEGHDHARARRVLGQYFMKHNLEAKAPAIGDCFDRIERELWASRAGPFDVDVQEFFHLATLSAFCRAMLSEDIFAWNFAGERSPRLAVARYLAHEVSNGSNVVGEHILYGIPMTSLLKRVRHLKAVVSTIRGPIFGPVVEKRRALVASGDAPDDCLTALLEHQRQDPTFGDADVLDQLITLVGAGHDTSAYFCCYACYLLAKAPAVQQALREELAAGRADWPDSLLKRVVQEVLRLYPVIPMVTRSSPRATELPTVSGATKRVPAGSRLVVPFFLLNRHPAQWGPDAAEFDPDRWLGRKRSEATFDLPQGFMPFGFGGRTCIGYSLALLEARVFFARLLARYTLREVPGFTPTIKAGISLTCENPKGIKVRLEKRA